MQRRRCSAQRSRSRSGRPISRVQRRRSRIRSCSDANPSFRARETAASRPSTRAAPPAGCARPSAPRSASGPSRTFSPRAKASSKAECGGTGRKEETRSPPSSPHCALGSSARSELEKAPSPFSLKIQPVSLAFHLASQPTLTPCYSDALLVILALALTNQKPLVVSPGSTIPSGTLASAVIYSPSFASTVTQLALSPDARRIILDSSSTVAEDLMATGKALVENGEGATIPTAEPTDLALTFISGGVALPYSHLVRRIQLKDGQLLTMLFQNLTAAMVSWLSLFPGAPQATRPTINDVVMSLHHPSTPYGFGFSLFFLYTSASLNLAPAPDSAEALDVLLNSAASPPITLLVGAEPILASSLHRHILNKMLGDASFIIRHSRTGKLALLRKGVLSQDTFWDWLMFSGVRKDAGLRLVRAVIISGAVDQSKTDLYRLVLGAPAMSTFEHPFSLAPLAAGLMWDLQRLPPPGGGERGHVGPPTAGTEIKLSGDESEIARGRIRGEVRSPLSASRTSLISLFVVDTVQNSNSPSAQHVCEGSNRRGLGSLRPSSLPRFARQRRRRELAVDLQWDSSGNGDRGSAVDLILMQNCNYRLVCILRPCTVRNVRLLSEAAPGWTSFQKMRALEICVGSSGGMRNSAPAAR